MEPEGSLPHSQAAATFSYPNPARSSPYPHFPLLGDPFNIIPPSTTYVFQVIYLLQVSPPDTLYEPFLSTVRKTFPINLIIHD